MASGTSLRERIAFPTVQFARINCRGIVTFCLLGVMALGALQYLGALYGVFSFGLRLRDENHQVIQLSEDVDSLELQVQRAAASFPIEHKDSFSLMEKISDVRYLTGENVAVSYVSVH